MTKVETTHFILAYLAAAVAAVSVVLAALAWLMGQPLAIPPGSYMTLATVAILFAIYFLIAGALYSAKITK